MRWTKILSGMVLVLTASLSYAQNRSNTLNRLIVKTKTQQHLSQGRLKHILPASEIRLLYSESRGQESYSNTFLIKLDSLQDVETVTRLYLSTGLFEYVEPDYSGYAATLREQTLIPDDTYFNRQWSHLNDGSFSLSPAKADADIDMPEAWNVTQGNAQIIVAILDSGIKTDHPEFDGRYWTNPDEIPGNGIDDDNNGYIDDIHGWNFVDDQPDLSDNIGHGTHVTGILGATGNNANGYAGVDWNCKLMICKVLKDDYSGFYSWWAEAIYYAVDHGASVINMSLGGTAYSRTLEDAVRYAYEKNVLVVTSMQNSNSGEVNYPAGYAHALAVGSTDPDDLRSTAFSDIPSYGSNFGNHIDVVAPGNFIYGISYQSDTDFNTVQSGTSEATPLVSGLASLLWAQKPGADVQVIENKIFLSSEDLVGDPKEDVYGWDPFYGYGRINAFRALTWTDELILQDEFNVYPNPFSDKINIQCQLRNESAVHIYLINSMGQIIKTMDYKSARVIHVTYATGGLSSGVYFLHIVTDSTRKTIKIIR